MADDPCATAAGWRCVGGRWFWPWHRWGYDGPAVGFIGAGYMRRCLRCAVRQEVVDA